VKTISYATHTIVHAHIFNAASVHQLVSQEWFFVIRYYLSYTILFKKDLLRMQIVFFLFQRKYAHNILVTQRLL